jgi:hypothetical protein
MPADALRVGCVCKEYVTSLPQQSVAHQLRRQRDACAMLGSPLYAGLLDRAAEDVEAGGPFWPVFEPFADWPGGSAYELRVMGALHRLVLSGDAPQLGPHFAPGGDPAAAWPVLKELLEERGDEVRDIALAHGVQTNEVGRCAALAPAILWCSRGKPLRLLELGASAGLNLRWDAYRYEDLWGDPRARVKLERRYEGTRPPFDPPAVDVIERSGCDANPVDPASDEGRLTLLSFVWPDQEERIELLRAALDAAPAIAAPVEKASAGDWLERNLAAPLPDGVCTVVFHSIFWQYMDHEERERVRSTLAETGARATADSPLAWVRMESKDELTRVEATLWPGGDTRLLARAGYHGRPVLWLA